MPFDSRPSPSDTDQELALLRATRALIDTPDKWLQGRSHAPHDVPGKWRFCVLGALAYAAGWQPIFNGLDVQTFYDPAEPSTRLLWRLNRAAHNNITSYNDYPKTTHNDIMNLLNCVEETLLRENVHAV